MPERIIDSNINQQLRGNGYVFQSEEFLHGGVSGSQVHGGVAIETPTKRHFWQIAAMQSMNLKDAVPAVLKLDKGIGPKEANGASFLQPFVPTAEILTYGPDYVLFKEAQGVTLDKMVSDKNDKSEESLIKFGILHANLWAQTGTSHTEHPLGGYTKKVGATKEVIYKQRLPGGEVIGDHAGKNIIVNGVPVGSFDQLFGRMDQIVGGQTRGAKTHGDEGWTNAMVVPDGSIVMIDNGTADYRSEKESIAKMLLWMSATKLVPQALNVAVKQHELQITAQSYLPPHLRKSVESIRRCVAPFISNAEYKKELAAFMTMYLLREVQWLERRGHPDMMPHIMAEALRYAPAIDGRAFPFPLNFEDVTKPQFFAAVASTESSNHPEVEHKQTKIVRIESASDVELAMTEMGSDFSAINLYSFDLDGTVKGKTSDGKLLKLPFNGLQALKKKGKYLTIASGAGVNSAVKKILSTLPPELSGDIRNLFDGNLIANEGADIFQLPSEGEVDPSHVIEEKALAANEIETALHILDQDGRGIKWMGVYPSVDAWNSNKQYHPFNYIAYIPNGAVEPSTADKLRHKYGDSILLTDSREEFYAIIQETGASKMVVETSRSDGDALMRDLIDGGIHAVSNEGYVNIVSREVNKFSGAQSVAVRAGLGGSDGSGIMHFGNDFNDLDALIHGDIGCIVNSDPAQTQLLIDKIQQMKQGGSLVIIEPDILDTLLLKIAECQQSNE